MSLEPTVWVVGDWQQAKFEEAMAWLKTRALCLWFENGVTALSNLRSTEKMDEPASILLLQSRPGQISRGDVERLHAAAPLARLVAVMGAWCEGELRSRQPWPGVVCVPVGDWRCGLEQVLDLDAANGRWRLPRTVTAGERIESILTAVKRRSRSRARVAVFSSRRANYEAIADMLQQLGFESVWQNERGECSATVDVVVFDGWENVRTGCDAGNRPPRVVLLHFSREEDFVRAREAGIGTVLQVPLLLCDLAETFHRILHNAAEPCTCASGLCE